MSQTPSTNREAQLTLRDRLNYLYFVGNQILVSQQASLGQEFTEKQVEIAIRNLRNMIPETWEDEKFREDMNNAKTNVMADIRPEFCGNKASLKFCQKHSIKHEKPTEHLDYDKVFQACINLFDRRDLITKKQKIEELQEIDADAIAADEIFQSDLPS